MLKKIFKTLAIFIVVSSSVFSQRSIHKNRPRLVVGVVVDQMCWDYLYKYYNRFGEGGFKRLLGEGFNCDNTLLPYIPSVTAVGHSTIYTGSVPAISGIAGNNFFIKNKSTYCTQDDLERTVGTSDSRSGHMSPRNMLCTTIGDELRLATNKRSKVIGVSIKDRAAILPGGHMSNGSFWLDDAQGYFITSTYYMKDLPQWVKDFNAKRLADKYLDEGWDTLYPKNTYIESTADDTEYEKEWDKNTRPTLPLDTRALKEKYGYSVLRSTPMGNSILFDFAKAAINGEHLGERKDETDMLTVSFSSTDYIGHRYGTNAVETEDCYLRLDKLMAEFLNLLDKKYGKDGYLFFLTADHAASHNVTYLLDNKIPAGAWLSKEAFHRADSVAKSLYPELNGLVLGVENYQVFINSDLVSSHNVDKYKLLKAIGADIERMNGVYMCVISEKLNDTTIPEFISERIKNGYRRGRSGDMFVILDPAWYEASAVRPKGTTHGVWANYDVHIPLIFLGKNIKKGHLHRRVYMTDIAATLAQWLDIQTPSGCIGRPIDELWTR